MFKILWFKFSLLKFQFINDVAGQGTEIINKISILLQTAPNLYSMITTMINKQKT